MATSRAARVAAEVVAVDRAQHLARSCHQVTEALAHPVDFLEHIANLDDLLGASLATYLGDEVRFDA